MYHFVKMTHIFEERVSPRHACILYSCFQNLEEKIIKIFELSSTTKEARFNDARHMKEVNKSIKKI